MCAMVEYIYPHRDPMEMDEETLVMKYRQAQFILEHIYRPHVPVPY